MLILSRRIGEVIYIGHNKEIAIKVVKLNNGSVSIGIEADKDIPIVREEVLERDEMLKKMATADEAMIEIIKKRGYIVGFS